MTHIRAITITPVAVKDPPLLNAVGVHEPYALRSVLQLVTDDGIVGLGETYGDDVTLGLLRRVAPALHGLDVFDLTTIRTRVAAALGERPSSETAPLGGTYLIGSGGASRVVSTVFAPFEVACLDAAGKLLGRPVSDLLGGRARERVDFSAYLFYKWGKHPLDPGYAPDDWGEALTVNSIVEQAGRMVHEYGFRSIKLKGGVLEPRHEVEAILALRDAFPDAALRIDPNTAWTVPTSIEVARQLDGVLEYLEDPTPTIDGMAAVARETSMPLATNMCVVEPAHLRPAVVQDAVQVVLGDHHFWGGLRATQALSTSCGHLGLGVSMHSNTHLGISLAAMTHLAAASPELTYSCDTHWPWKGEDVIEPGVLTFADGALEVPTTAGLGVTLDEDALGRLHRQWSECGQRSRNDRAARQVVDPGWIGNLPRF